MTKSPLALATLLVAAILLPAIPVEAHGTPAARDIDARVLADANSLTILDYCAANGLAEDGGQSLPPAAIPFCEGGHDLLTLDLREAYGPGIDADTVEPGLYARLIFRRGFVELNGPITDTIRFTVGGAEKALTLTTADNQVFTSPEFTWVSEKSAAATYESQVFAFAPYSVLGGTPGDTLESISVISHAGDKPTDVMPGTYYFEGEYVPDEAAQPAADTGPGAYTLAGPATLFTATADLEHLDLATTDEATLTLAFASLTSIPQVLTVEVMGEEDRGFEVQPAGEAQLADKGSNASLSLVARRAIPDEGHGPHGGHGDEGVAEDHDEGSAHGNGTATLVLVVTSDLGGRQVLEVPVELPAPAPVNHTEEHGHEHDDDHEHEKESPGVAAPLLLAIVALALLLRRRRA